MGGIADKDSAAIAEVEMTSFRRLFSTLWRRRRTIALFVAIMLLAALAYIFTTPTRYTATSTFVLDLKRHTQSEVVDDSQIDDAAVESHVETIKSENVGAFVIRELKLAQDPEFLESPAVWEKLLGGKNAEESPSSGDDDIPRVVMEQFRKGLQVNRIPRSYVVEIAFTSLDPKKAAVIANTIAKGYIEDQLQAKYEATKRGSTWLQKSLDELRSQAADAFRNVQEFKSINNLVISGDGKPSFDLELDRLAESLARARADTAQAQSRLSDIEKILAENDVDGARQGSVTEALSNPIITRLQQQYLDDKRREIAWASRYGPNHEAVTKVKQEMAGLKRAIREEMQRIAQTFESDLKVAQAREGTIERRISEVFHKNNGNRRSQVKLRELEIASDTYRTIYENFLNRYTLAVKQKSFPFTEARIITPASIGKKTSPKSVLSLIVALAGGLILGMAAALIQDQLSRTIYVRDQLVRELQVTCICALPIAASKNKLGRGLAPMITSWGRVISWTNPALKNERGPPTLLYGSENSFSEASEALRNLKVAVDVRRTSGQTRTLAIVSAGPGEGKSSVAVSLATAIADAGRKVMLIDCDFRNPSLTKFLGLQSRAGVFELLSGENKREDFTYHSQHGFDFLCAPTEVRPTHSADILGSLHMSKLLEELNKDYDYVIADLPPILAVMDVFACAHLFDGFVMIAQWGKTKIDDLDRALSVTPVVRERLLGIVLSKVDVKTMQCMEGGEYPVYGYYV